MQSPNFLKIILLLTITFLFACKKEEPLPPVQHPEPFDQNFLFWEISGNGLSQPSYLFGTIHLIPAKDVIFEAYLDSLLRLVDEVVLEVNPNDPDVQKISMKHLMLSDPAQKIYTNEEEAILHSFCQQYGLPWNQMKQYKPIVLQSIFGQVIMNNIYNGQVSGYEELLLRKAPRAGVQVKGAEEAEYAYSYFELLDIQHQVADLLEFVQLPAHEQKESLEDLVNLYNSQNLTKVYDEMTRDFEGRNYKQVLLDGRNLHWMNSLISIEKSRLIAVGAAHLPGEKGLLKLLKDAGYTIEPIKTM